MAYPYYQQNSTILWVQGETGAKSYPIAPNSSVVLMDSETNRFYIKATDQTGIPKLRTFDYTEVNDQVPSEVTRAEYNELLLKINDLEKKLEEKDVDAFV